MSAPGEVLADRYELRRLLGRGGMGEVWHAFDRELERDVALKSLLPHLLSDPELVGRFRREARALARLRHPGIVAVFDILRLPDGRIYIVLEFVPGEPLDHTIARGPMTWERVVGIGAGVCDALEAAHREGVVHRDIKPSNILVEPRGQVRVADFGLARLQAIGGTSESDVVTRTGIVMGTPGYWAPEQALGRRITPQTDLYSLGSVLFEAATGRLPFVPEEPGPAAAFMHIAAPVPDPRTIRPDLSPAAAALLMRTLAKDPAERFGSAADMAAALRETVAPRRPPAPTVTAGAAPTAPLAPGAPLAGPTAVVPGATEFAPAATAAAPAATAAAPAATA
ncbi:MAG TPA: serine/threonine-protein kinase, partial [Miltoncostaeaceae bacterium]|nr:serine/threonine-protein kinase [Miltoncostaeaceae bacterium]